MIGFGVPAGAARPTHERTSKPGTPASLAVGTSGIPDQRVPPEVATTLSLPAAVSGMASLSHYIWLGGTYTKFYEHSGEKRPDVLDYSLVYGYRPPKWRRPPDKWDWRMFGELVGERSDRFLEENASVANTQAHQVFLGPTALGIFYNYTVSFGAQFPIYQNVGSAFPKERVRFAINFSYLLFQHDIHTRRVR